MMETNKSIGRTAGRYIRSIALAEGQTAAAEAYAEAQNWIDKTAIISQIKAAVSGSTLADIPQTDVGADFMMALRPRAILSRLDRARKVPSRVNMIAFGAGTKAYPVNERKLIPVSRTDMNGIQVIPIKVGGISVVTNELLNNSIPGTDEALAADLALAVGEAEDATFFSPAVPGSIMNTAPTAASSGTSLANVDADLQKAVELLLAAGGKLRDGAWIMAPESALKLAGMRGTGGALAFPNIGVDGGELLKLPVITSESASGYLGLIDQSGVLVSGDARAEITLARNATLQMSDTPDDQLTATSYVSMFQTECTAIKGVLHRGWKARAGSASYISGGLW